ncbi:hypothetical protein [Rhizobium phaseoli]|uniref:Uncharacterized protein n=1 Tax=Rhizobium phaseoli TaxID=396 RepID=A0ABM6CFQ2_9HYPH|nr:hypothetical protein [Rhizobium phaseoli]ANL87117.1 hypothetical protein AMC81_PA00096 [Rhizobium phaseoli]ANL93626.1 hypothetical protein AMC80_PA00096 [Rhizobium phaseoli]
MKTREEEINEIVNALEGFPVKTIKALIRSTRADKGRRAAFELTAAWRVLDTLVTEAEAEAFLEELEAESRKAA